MVSLRIPKVLILLVSLFVAGCGSPASVRTPASNATRNPPRTSTLPPLATNTPIQQNTEIPTVVAVSSVTATSTIIPPSPVATQPAMDMPGMASTLPSATMAGMDMSSMATATPLSNSATATLTTLERFAALNATPSPTEAMAGMDMSDVATIAPLPINGDAVRGKVLFREGIGKPEVPACVTCHYDDQDEVKVGPALSDIATHGPLHAAELGQDVVTFLRHSITTPNENLMTDPVHVFAVNGVSLMYQNYAKELTPAQIDDLVAYLLTLK